MQSGKNKRKGKSLYSLWLWTKEAEDIEKALKDKDEKLLLAIFEEINKRRDFEKR